jgi:hypothetical protein
MTARGPGGARGCGGDRECVLPTRNLTVANVSSVAFQNREPAHSLL